MVTLSLNYNEIRITISDTKLTLCIAHFISLSTMHPYSIKPFRVSLISSLILKFKKNR